MLILFLWTFEWLQDGSEGGVKAVVENCVVRDMSLAQAAKNQGSLAAAISYSSITGDATACDQQYNRSNIRVL